MDPWVKGYAVAEERGLSLEAHQAARLLRRSGPGSREQAADTGTYLLYIYMHPTDRMSKEDGRLTGGRFQFASDPVAFEVKYATTTYTKEVALTFRAGPVCGGGWGTANARRAIVREVFMVD